jgi:hypothetical protein
MTDLLSIEKKYGFPESPVSLTENYVRATSDGTPEERVWLASG